MTFNPQEHHRRSIRARGYDYSQPGVYFVTLCTARRACNLGYIQNGKMLRNDVGEAIQRRWLDLPAQFAEVTLDTFVIMPNHLHGIIVLTGPRPPQSAAHIPRMSTDHREAPTRTRKLPTLGHIVGTFKSRSAIEANRILHPIGRPFWQRNYYNHVVRRGRDLDEIRRYIAENPMKWCEDPENPYFR